LALRDVQEMFETSLEPFDVLGGQLGDDYRGYLSPATDFSALRLVRTRNYEPSIDVARAPPEIFPTVVVRPAVEPERVFVDPVTGSPAVEGAVDMGEVPVIDPETAPTATVYESQTVPAGIYETNRAPTDWDRVYAEYVELNAPKPVQEDDVAATDWGDWRSVLGTVAGGVVGGLFDPVGLGGLTQNIVSGPALPAPQGPISSTAGGSVMQMPANATCGPVGPKYAKICLATGQVMPLRRRRRRRLLTASDLADISSLVAIVGKGAATNAVVTRAVSRS